ncbi:MAG: hypothetical protein GVY30_00325 [Chloroflexi bacterium]|jgi:hypothetical protein|nr:hypothetical protein [Chloroflexota bacterium]
MFEKKWLHRLLLVIALMLLSLGSFTAAYAGTYSGWFTGYAMGNQYGGAGVEISQGHFANHYVYSCPGDPAAHWNWGTQITTPWIGMQDQAGRYFSRNLFYLYDVGDFSCSQGNYWVDIYFGRYRYSGESCNCPGVPNPGYCYTGNTNSCTQAINFGRSWKTYSQP